MAVATGTSTISWSVNAYQSSFAALEDATDKRWQLEDLVRSGLSALGQILHSIDAWRERVRRGEQNFSDQDDQDYRDVLSRWVDQTRDRVLPRVNQFEQTCGDCFCVSGSQCLKMDLIKAEETLRSWKPPVLSKYPTLRHVELTEVESRTALATIAEQTGKPPRQFRRVQPKHP